MKKRIISFLALLILPLVVFSACKSKGEEPTIPANEMVKKAINNLSEVKTAKLMVKAQGDASVKEDNVNFDATLDGAYDSTNPEMPLLLLKIDGKGKGKGAEQNVSAEMRVLENNIYFVLNKISDFDGQVPKDFIQPFIGKWWSVPIPDEYKQSLSFGDESKMTPEQKKIKELFDKTNFFKDAEFVGNEKLNGEQTFKYKVKLDEEAISKYLIDSADILAESQQGQKLTEEEIKSIKDMWKYISFEGNILVGEKDETVRQISGVLKADNKTEEYSGTVNFTYTISDLNKTVDIKEPKDAQVFDPFAILGGGNTAPTTTK